MIPPWLAIAGAAALFVWIAVATWTWPATPMWLAGALAFLAAEAWTLQNKRPGDTLSGHIWRWARGARWRAAILAAILSWLAWHFILSPNMPR